MRSNVLNDRTFFCEMSASCLFLVSMFVRRDSSHGNPTYVRKYFTVNTYFLVEKVETLGEKRGVTSVCEEQILSIIRKKVINL